MGHGKVLIVDDDDTFRTMLSCALEDTCSVISAADGESAMELARSELPDVIIMDVMMPNMGGLEALRALQQEDATAHIPVLICTGSNFDQEMHDVFQIEKNCLGFFSKTAPLDFILGMTEKILERGRRA